jgi:hypothetical protein
MESFCARVEPGEGDWNQRKLGADGDAVGDLKLMGIELEDLTKHHRASSNTQCKYEFQCA